MVCKDPLAAGPRALAERQPRPQPSRPRSGPRSTPLGVAEQAVDARELLWGMMVLDWAPLALTVGQRCRVPSAEGLGGECGVLGGTGGGRGGESFYRTVMILSFWLPYFIYIAKHTPTPAQTHTHTTENTLSCDQHGKFLQIINKTFFREE